MLAREFNRLQRQFIYDSTDGDLSGARVWATGPFTMSFGQNSNRAVTGAPALDMGYVALPGTDFISLVLGVTKSANPQVVPTASGQGHPPAELGVHRGNDDYHLA